MASCAVPSLMAKDPRFQELKKAYSDKHYSDDHLAQALQLCREYHDYDDDWYPVTPAQRGVFTRFMNYYLTTAKLSDTSSELGRDSVYNLYTTLYTLYTPEQLDSRISMLSRDFRELVDRLESKDRSGRTRQELITAQARDGKNGYVSIMEQVFKIYENQYTDVDKMMAKFDARYPTATAVQRETARKNAEYRASEYKIVLANKERLSALAATRIGEEEGFVVSIRDFEVKFEDFNDDDTLAEGVETQDNQAGEDKEEGSKGERYGDFRTLKLINTLSAKAKRLIGKIQKVDSNGKPIRDDLGVVQYVGGRQVAVVLKKVLVNSSPETMMSDLKAAADFYPWITGLVSYLESDTDSQATVYNNFKNAETTYVYVNLENGSYKPSIANSRSAGNALMREAGNNLRAGYILDESNSIYTGFGSLVSKDAIEKIHSEFNAIKKLVQNTTRTIRMVEGDKLITKAVEEDISFAAEDGIDLSYLREGPEDAMRKFLSNNPDVAPKLASMLRGMGFAVSAKDIATIATQTMTQKGFAYIAGVKRASSSTRGRNKLWQLVDNMDGVYNRAEQIYKQNLTTTGQYLYNTSESFNRINRCLALAQYHDVEARVLNEGKSLSTYNNVNLLHQTFDDLMNRNGRSEEQYQEDLENNYLQYEGMAIGKGQNRTVAGWLQMLQENRDGIRDKLRVLDIAAFNHVEYARLSRGQKLTNSLVMFFNSSNTFKTDGFAAYEVPIQADYSTAYNFVLAPKLSTEGDNSELLEALVDETLIELDRIAAIQERLKNDNRVKLSVYEKRGLKFQIFPAFNDNGFIEGYKNAEDPRDFVRERVSEQLEDIVTKDFATINASNILSNPAMKSIHFGYGNYGSLYAEDGKIESLSDDAKAKLRDFCLNVFYAREQMVKILTGGLEQFNGLIDYEKRNMMTHATRTSLYTKATWKGKRVGKESQNVVYIEDDEAQSAFLSDIKDMLGELLAKKVISKSQFDTMVKAYSKIKTTDGQGFRTLESYRTVMIMADQWDDRHEDAYVRIMRGVPTKSDIDVFMQNIKPVLTGYEHIDAAEGENQKPVKLTVLHKYSEQVLLPMTLAKYCLQTQSAPLQALENAQQRLKKQGKEIDMFLLHSGVKVGAHSIVQPFAKDEKGNRLLSDAKSMEDYIVDSVTGTESTIHVLPFKYYGIAASTPAHAADDKIAWASQAEKVAWANISKGDKITIAGEEMEASAGRELYNSIKTADIVESYKKLRELFVDSDELERIFQEELASKSYSSRELQYALSHLKDGTFALPLFSPNIEHQVQELLASIIKKRLTKPRVKGANILQSTGLGMDIEASAFDNNNALSEDDKLRVVFDGTGAGKRVKYVEVFLPIHDSRLKIFADANGNIGPERLRELVNNGTIPESILDFIAYRTPSDAEHSVIPCRIKGFYANTGGATIKMPKEIMVMTGHDYDGDKMRCHFKNFALVDKDGNEANMSDEDVVKMVLGQKAVNPSWKKVEDYKYDYDKSPLENSRKARENARVELMFAELTSPAGSRRMLIPGGCDETKVIAKSLYIVRASRDDSMRKKLVSALESQGVDSDEAQSIVKSSSRLYETLIRKSDGTLSDIIREVSSAEIPYSLTHSVDAFEYIMGGSEMIGIYAMYNSAFQMFQRLDMNYVPKVTKNGRPYKISFFGHTWDKLFDTTNHDGKLASLGLARLLNAAVDNNKDPVLGYLMQTPEMAEMTFMMFAAGMTEEEIHLIINQPAVVELIERLKSRDSLGMVPEISSLVKELAGDNQNLNSIYPYLATINVSKMSREDYTSNLNKTFDEVKTGQDYELLVQQISILQTLSHLSTAAGNLAQFVKLTRPESESGAIGTTVASIVAKTIELNKFRDKLLSEDDSSLRISGMRDVLARRDVHEGWDTKYIEEILGTQLPEVVALNSLMLDSSLDMFKPFFPQAKQSWVDLQKELSDEYSYNTAQEGTIKKIANEMILWKLLSNKKFITGNPQEEQRRIIIDVPKQVRDLKIRIADAEKGDSKDAAAKELIGNSFLLHLTATSPENSNYAPRLMFSLNGPAVEGQADSIRAHWSAMLNSPDDTIRQLAIDLFKYNLYTNGFSYGMYEFAHMAPFSVLAATPNYIEALQDVLKSDWKDDRERENFINQYIMNHWGDKRFLSAINKNDLNIISGPETAAGQLWIRKSSDSELLNNSIKDKRYVIITSGERGEKQDLYRVESGNADDDIILVKAQKLGVRNRSQQVTLQYNPTLDFRLVKPVVAGNESAWGQLDSLSIYATANINAPGAGENAAPVSGGSTDIFRSNQMPVLNYFGILQAAATIPVLEKKAEAVAKKNEKKHAELRQPETAPMPTLEDMQMPVGDAFGLGSSIDMSALQSAVARVSTEDENESEGKMFSIARVDENGKVVVDNLPVTPNTIALARKQKTFVELNKKLREILRSKGVDVGVLTNAEARMALGGVTDFDTANVTAEGLLEMVRIANGYEGEQALPEEFAHVALEMLGHNHTLVNRLLTALDNSHEAMQEAYNGMYDEYEQRYGEQNHDKLVLEAAGKLVAKQLFREQQILTNSIRRIVTRVVDAIKALLRRFSRDEIQNAIFDANQIASKIAREMLGGRLLDDMSLDNISSSEQFYSIHKDLSGKSDILSKLLKTETKRLSVLEKRLGYASRNGNSAAVDATKAQIDKLEAAIRNYKTEDAITTYMSDSLAFLAATEKSLDDAVNSGRPMNSICKKLNTVRDTLYSFSKSIEDIREAIVDGEVQDNENLTASMDRVSGVLAKFYQKYETLARTYFEEMLSSVYGEHGKTVTIGREKGRVISIKEMARKADHDISLASRWFYSIADCDDYVLKAIDDVTRDAKMRARRKASSVRPRIEAAMAELIRETGSRDQSFMFEMALGEDGKMHKTGSYITAEKAKSLSPAQKKFYDEMLAIKHEADKCIPEVLIKSQNQIVMVRKYTMDRFKDAEGAKGKALEAWEGLKNRVMDTSDDFDPENHEVVVDFQGNRVDMLPVKFVQKGKKESYDDMTDDVASSIMAYAGMAYEYNELNGVINVLENAKYMAGERDVIQKTGRRTQRESIDTDEVSFKEPFTKKAARLKSQQALEDFFSMHLYGHTTANEGTFGNTRISKRKVVDTVNHIVSLSQMALNLPQRIANVATGGTQVVIESAGNGVFNAKDVSWASAIYAKESADRLAQTGTTDYDNKLSLWNEYFDVHQDNGRTTENYKKGRMSRIFNESLLYAGLQVGEDYLASITSLAAARNFKVKDANGKESNLWDAYEVKYKDAANKTGAYLALKDGYTKADGSPITFEDEKNFAKSVIGLNFDMQGIYNLDDRSAIQQYAFGALIIMYRKWIAPAIKRRYGATQYNALKGADEEGYHRTLFRTLYDSLVDAKDAVTEEKGAAALMNIIEDVRAFSSAVQLNWEKLTDYEKSNVRKAMTELGIVLGLFLSTSLLLRLPPDDHDGNETLEWMDNFAMSQLLRLRAEIGAQAPTPMFVGEALRILKSPFAAIGPIKSTLNVFQLMLPHNYFTEIKSGRYKGHSKAYKYFREFPIISMFKKIDNFVDPSPLIQYYKNDTVM